MNAGDEVLSPTREDATPLPIRVGESALPCAQPTPASVLGWIAEATSNPGEFWFPSRFAAATGTDRDALDEPLGQLRLTGLIRVASWVRGVGQGYVLTPEGEKAHATGVGIPTAGKPIESASGYIPAIPDDPARSLDEFAHLPPSGSHPPVVVPALLIANGLWFFVGMVSAIRSGQSFWNYLVSVSGDPALLHRLGSVSGEDLLRGDWWRLLTCCFVHSGGVHLLANFFALAMVGPLAELLWGRRGLAIIYLLSGLGGSCLAMSLDPLHPLVGASGAIWGVLVSVLVWFVVFRTQIPLDDANDVIRWLMVALVVNVGASFLPGVSWQAHLGGALAGAATALCLAAIRVCGPRWRKVSVVLIFVLPAAAVGSLIVVMGRGEEWIAYREQVDAFHKQRAAAAAIATFERDVAPRLNQLKPEDVNPVQARAVMQLLRPGARRSAAIVAEVRQKLTEMKSLADQSIGLLAGPPIGVEPLDQRRSWVKEFAEARSRSFAQLLDMLASDAIPDEAAWCTWGAAKTRANELWKQLASRKPKG
jgi:membrane associated rhomboid family serine protease